MYYGVHSSTRLPIRTSKSLLYPLFNHLLQSINCQRSISLLDNYVSQPTRQYQPSLCQYPLDIPPKLLAVTIAHGLHRAARATSWTPQ